MASASDANVNLDSTDVEEEEDEIFSVSGRGRQGSFQRGAQSSHFGAVDEGIELNIGGGDEDDDVPHQGDQGYQRARPRHQTGDDPSQDRSSYQAERPAPSAANAAASQHISQEIDEMLDNLLSAIGLGKFHALLLVVCGLGLFHCSVQLGFIGILLPDISRDLCLSDTTTGWLRGSVFVGVMLASVVWGCAADLGSRRITLTVCLVTTGITMAIAACFSQSRSALLAFLIIDSLSTGGVISISLTYMFEFLPKRSAQRMLCGLLAFTVIGGMFVPIVATAFASSASSIGSVYRTGFANWRIFCLVLSLLPVVAAMILTCLLPESPYLLLEKRQWADAIQVLARVYSYNHGEAGLEVFKDRANGLYRLKRHSKAKQAPTPSTHLQSCTKTVYRGIKNITVLLDRTTLLMAAGAFLIAFGYCAWTLWLTDLITANGLEYNATVIADITFSDEIITSSLQRQTFINTTFHNVSFVDVHIRDVSCSGCLFTGCAFRGVMSEATVFARTVFANTTFRDTDFQPRQFTDGSEFVNCTGPALGTPSGPGMGYGCTVDVPFAPATAYWQIMFGQSGGVLGLVLSLFITRIIETWRLFMCGALVTAVTILVAFLPLFGWTAAAHLFAIQFGGFVAWSALIVQAAMSFPTDKRATGLSLLLSVVTTAGLLGFLVVVALPQFIDVIVTAVAVIGSAVCSYFFDRHPQDQVK